jgi:8-oxo-dGTP diphosphatase
MAKNAELAEAKNVFEEVHPLFEQYIPQISIDCVIFGFHDNTLKVLLSKFPKVDLWALQGGFVFQNEDIDVASVRILKELTSLSDIFLKQFHTFGKATRPTLDGTLKHKALEMHDFDFKSIPFLNQRFISIGYYSLVDYEKVSPSINEYFENSAWHDIHDLPVLILDHAEMIEKALETMRQSLDYQLIGFNLMPPTFTMKELQHLYETILDEPLKRNNFQEKILGLNILERLEKQYSGGAHKAPYLYRFKI